MIAICPAGPPKLMKPSLSQNSSACLKLTGSLRGFAESGCMLLSFIGLRFHGKGRQQSIEDGAGGVQ